MNIQYIVTETVSIDECPICYENKRMVTLNCNHKCCSECIKNWITKKQTCMICRKQIRELHCNPDDMPMKSVTNHNIEELLSNIEDQMDFDTLLNMLGYHSQYVRRSTPTISTQMSMYFNYLDDRFDHILFPNLTSNTEHSAQIRDMQRYFVFS